MSTKHRGHIEGAPVTQKLPTPAGGVKLETFVPWRLVQRGIRRAVIAPPGAQKAAEVVSAGGRAAAHRSQGHGVVACAWAGAPLAAAAP